MEAEGAFVETEDDGPEARDCDGGCDGTWDCEWDGGCVCDDTLALETEERVVEDTEELEGVVSVPRGGLTVTDAFFSSLVDGVVVVVEVTEGTVTALLRVVLDFDESNDFGGAAGADCDDGTVTALDGKALDCGNAAL